MNTSTYANGVMVEQTIDNGDGTGTRTTYGPGGQVTGTEAVTGLPVAEPVAVPPTDAEIEAARLSLAAATTVSQTKARALALDDLRAAQIAAITT